MCDFANANHYEKKMQLGRAKIIIVDDRSEVKMVQMYWDFRQLNLFPRAFSNGFFTLQLYFGKSSPKLSRFISILGHCDLSIRKFCPKLPGHTAFVNNPNVYSDHTVGSVQLS